MGVERGSEGERDEEAEEDLGVAEKFTSYIKNIGFEWLLNHCEEEVSVPLAKEFFTSFHFKVTIDPDAESISFRLFNQDMTMSIREWLLRMRLFTLEEDDAGDWNVREIGQPRMTEGFVPEDARRMLTHKKGGSLRQATPRDSTLPTPSFAWLKCTSDITS